MPKNDWEQAGLKEDSCLRGASIGSVMPAKAGIQIFVCASRAGFRLAPE
jgi:hypothetical protein